MSKNRFRGAMLAAAATLVIGLAAPSFAEEALPDDDRLDDAWADLSVDQEPILSELQFAKLNNVAFQAAVTKICDGYQLDQQKFADAVADATFPAPEKTATDPSLMKQWETAVYFRLGANYGLFLAEGNANADSFCESAAELKADPSVPNVWQ
ncbi:MAG: hypothetical protein J0H08_06215 [Rhizobiales bacterium]|jgi:hypothetical protein|nr:hypothetical protein [Hyphomicrobiales bacterium]